MNRVYLLRMTIRYLREFEHITLARLLLARYKKDPEDHVILDALGLLERLLKAAEEGGQDGKCDRNPGPAGACPPHARQPSIRACGRCSRALTLAEPEGYMRIFLDGGTSMAKLLREAAARGIMPDYTGKLLAAFEGEQSGGAAEALSPTAAIADRAAQPARARSAPAVQNRAFGPRDCP